VKRQMLCQLREVAGMAGILWECGTDAGLWWSRWLILRSLRTHGIRGKLAYGHMVWQFVTWPNQATYQRILPAGGVSMN